MIWKYYTLKGLNDREFDIEKTKIYKEERQDSIIVKMPDS